MLKKTCLILQLLIIGLLVVDCTTGTSVSAVTEVVVEDGPLVGEWKAKGGNLMIFGEKELSVYGDQGNLISEGEYYLVDNSLTIEYINSDPFTVHVSFSINAIRISGKRYYKQE